MKSLVAKLLVVIVVVGSMLSAPPVMAMSMAMPASAQATAMAQNQTGASHCALCQYDAQTQTPQQPAQPMTNCPVAATCVMAMAIPTSHVAIQAHTATTLLPDPTEQMGRLLDGPDPFPPRRS